MFREIIPIWVTYYARDILKLDKVNKLNSYDNKYHMIMNLVNISMMKNKEKKRGIFYTIIILFVFFNTFYGCKLRSY